MGQFTGRLVTSFVMFLIALTLLVLGYTLGNWLDDAYSYELDYTSYNNYNYFSGSYLSGSSSYWWNNVPGSSGPGYTNVIGAGYTSAMRGTLLAAISLTSISLVLSIIMVCADLCFRITQSMAVIPKVTTGLAVIAGVLASVTCVLYLVRYYVFQHAFGFAPNYPFFLVLFTGIFLKIAGCVNNGANQAGVVGDSGNAVMAMSSASQSQSQSVPQTLSAYNLYNQSTLPYGGTTYATGMMSGSQFQSGMPPGYQQQMFNAPPYIGVNPNPEHSQSAMIDTKKSID